MTLKDNSAPKERVALHESSKRHDIIISNADKGGAVANQDVKYYTKEAERQLGDKEYHKMLDSDPTGTHKKLVDQIIDWFKRYETLKEKKLQKNLK